MRLKGISTDCDVVVSLDECDDGDPESDGGSTVLEVKRESRSASQAIGAAVVSSLDFPSLNSLVPCILLNYFTVQVYVYDVSDVLLITQKVDFRKGTHVQKSGILFLWLFINHRYVTS